MLNFIYLSQTTPCNESCAQVGEEDYMTNARIEARVYIDQLKRVVGENPEGTNFKMVHCPHDFGTYLDIKFFYDDEVQRHVKYALDIEEGCGNWDQVASLQLKACGYRALTNENMMKGH